MTTNTPMAAPSWLTRREAAAHLRCSIETLDVWRRGDQPPPEHRTPGGKPLFDRDELDAWLRSRCTTTPTKRRRWYLCAACGTRYTTTDPDARLCPTCATDPDDDPIAELVG